MSRPKLPEFAIEKGICLIRRIPFDNDIRQEKQWYLIGRLDDATPFLLSYSQRGYTNWWCPQLLGDSLRKKILKRVREDLRLAEQVPDYVAVHDLQALDLENLKDGSLAAESISKIFFDQVWRAEYLGERDEDYVVLEVPFAEKEAVKALGAKWNGELRKWQIKRSDDMAIFDKWITP